MDDIEGFLTASVMTAEQQANMAVLAQTVIQFYKDLVDGGIPEPFAVALTSQLLNSFLAGGKTL